jgi:hypothetical protein
LRGTHGFLHGPACTFPAVLIETSITETSARNAASKTIRACQIEPHRSTKNQFMIGVGSRLDQGLAMYWHAALKPA